MSKDLGKAPAPHNEPDEDVNDLDDVLDQFNPTSRPVLQAPAEAPPQLSEDFSAQLAAGMEALMRDLGQPSSSGEDSAAQAAWEKSLPGMKEATRGGIDIPGAPDSAAPGKAPAGPASVEDLPQNVDEFQRKILEEMHCQSDSSNPSDPLAKLLSDLDLGGLDADGQEANEGDFQTMIEGMMTQLMPKDILYDPLKELRGKASFLDHNSLKEYPQSTKILEVTHEGPQSLGSSPEEIMGGLPPGMNINADGLPVPKGCITA